MGWSHQGFRLFWTWKPRRRTARPAVPKDVRDLIRPMSGANPLWGAPRIHGELLKLGITISQPTVATYMLRHPTPPSQTWRTFLANHLHEGDNFRQRVDGMSIDEVLSVPRSPWQNP